MELFSNRCEPNQLAAGHASPHRSVRSGNRSRCVSAWLHDNRPL